jgi:hypothetical protein
MANSKISALAAATTPLAGTEVLPVVQGGITEQVSVANLTAGRDVSASGLLVDANSATAAVRITQLGAGNALLVEDSASTDSTPFVITADGRIVSGATSLYPSPVNTSFTDKLQLNGATTYDSSADFISWSTGTDTGTSLNLARSDSGTIGAHAVVGSTDIFGNVRFFGSDGANFIEGAKISAGADGTPGTNDMPSRLVFSTTADGASSPTERMRLNSAGAVAFNGATNYGTSGQVLTSNGNAAPTWTTVSGGALAKQTDVFTSGTAATYTAPANTQWVKITVVGLGPPGTAVNGGRSQGSSAGGVAIKWLAMSAGQTLTYTVSTTVGVPSTVISGTLVISPITANSGTYGGGFAYGASSTATVAGGTATGGDINITGGEGGRAYGTSAAITTQVCGSGGSCPGFGTGGIGAAITAGGGGSAQGFGAGGGGSLNSFGFGAGGPSVIIFEAY